MIALGFLVGGPVGVITTIAAIGLFEFAFDGLTILKNIRNQRAYNLAQQNARSAIPRIDQRRENQHQEIILGETDTVKREILDASIQRTNPSAHSANPDARAYAIAQNESHRPQRYHSHTLEPQRTSVESVHQNNARRVKPRVLPLH